MDIRRALSIFRLNNRISLDQLNSLFRELVKKYHPDRVRDYPDWAHERMSEINDAYKTVVEWLANPPEESKEGEIAENQEGIRGHEEGGQGFHTEISPLSAELETKFQPAFNKFLNGLGIYYQYGLENHECRQEGIRRFRFREASRLITEGRNELELLLRSYHHPIFRIVARFARLTAADIGIAKVKLYDRGSFHTIDMRLDMARRNFEDAIKEFFFPEFIPNHLRGRALIKLYTCYAEFAMYMIIFNRGKRYKVGVLLTARYDALMNLMKLRDSGLLPL